MNANLTFVEFMYYRLQVEMSRYLNEYNTFERLPENVSVEEYYFGTEDKSTLSPVAIVDAIYYRANSLESLKVYSQILIHLQILDPRLRHVNDAIRRYIYEAVPVHVMTELDDGEFTDHEDDLTEEELEDFIQMGGAN